mmetsp:Transcript_58973/g.164805  ORF Transcript_58973/g.164805 Transcript_58973/m.164805 type:complete len:217 (+) Transcript_58973:259-909(+)
MAGDRQPCGIDACDQHQHHDNAKQAGLWADADNPVHSHADPGETCECGKPQELVRVPVEQLRSVRESLEQTVEEEHCLKESVVAPGKFRFPFLDLVLRLHDPSPEHARVGELIFPRFFQLDEHRFELLGCRGVGLVELLTDELLDGVARVSGDVTGERTHNLRDQSFTASLQLFLVRARKRLHFAPVFLHVLGDKARREAATHVHDHIAELLLKLR